MQLRAQIGSSRLGFASEERLQKHLGLLRGAVSPLGAINDAAHAVEILIDSSLNGNVPLELHLGVNTATIWIRFDDLLRFLHAQGSRVRMIEL